MKLSDLTGIFRKSLIRLLKKEKLCEDYYVFDFVCEHTTPWKVGDHGIFSIANKNIQGRKWRIFSIASITDENIIRISTRINDNPSAFKQHLLTLELQDTLSLRGPFGWFSLQDNLSPVIMIAGGIGIAPFMSFLKEMKKENKRDVHLLYSAKQQHPFKDEIVDMSQHINGCTITLINNREALLQAIDKNIECYRSSAFYYISGTPAMVKTVRKYIRDNKISRKRILSDSFIGY